MGTWPPLSAVEICAGAGGQALGLEAAGFTHASAVEIEAAACETLTRNRPEWNVLLQDVRSLSGRDFHGIDLLAGGVPCPPFSIAGRQLGGDDERDLFPTAIRLIAEAEPRAVMLENVPGLASIRFSDYRRHLAEQITRLGYEVDWRILNACDYGVPQLRPRFVLVALRPYAAGHFSWPEPGPSPPTVGMALEDLMASGGWKGASSWSARASGVGPTLVGGSKKHGGPDVGPSRARAGWMHLGVDGRGIADGPPPADFPIDGLPRLTVRMGARVQGFPDSWEFAGRKTAAWRQVGNAFPPPVAQAVGHQIARALMGKRAGRRPGQLALKLATA